ncbi:hypothetical protein SPFL3102_01767 [Sporomusaceae bacterium FL31]|nr:hypothetical protein SPFL3101_03401 [Sporomusaceae bacterium FL31]GCE33958.1 hypothetical protein SPFL3102_01767 [Sporomusaceae bacterium]
MFIKRTIIPLLVLMVFVAAFTAGCFNKSAKDTNATPASVGVIDMTKAVQAHPKYQQLNTLKQQFNMLVAQAQAQSKQQPGSSLSSVKPLQDHAALNTAFEQEYKEKMSAKQSELHQSLVAKADQLRSQLATEFKEYTDEIDKEYQPQIFSLQLKLKTLQLSKEELAAFQAELEKVQQIRSDKLAVKEKQLTEQMDKTMAPAQVAVEQELAAYSQQLNNQLAQKAAAKGAEIEARNSAVADANRLANAATSNQIREIEQQAGMKKQEASVLEQAIIQDVRDKAAKVAAERQLDTIITNIQINVNAVDITEAVIAEFKKQ